MSRRLIFFNSKPKEMCFGGDDAFLIDLMEHWPSPDDHITFVLNASHPAIDLYSARLGSRASLLLLKEELLYEKRQRIASFFRSPGLRFVVETLLDLLRPFYFLAALGRLSGFLRKNKPDVVVLLSGGNPPSDLCWRL